MIEEREKMHKINITIEEGKREKINAIIEENLEKYKKWLENEKKGVEETISKLKKAS